MAIEIRFNDYHTDNSDFISCKSAGDGLINIEGDCGSEEFLLVLDIPTAIKFAKTVRTEINKAKKELEDKND